MPDTPYIHTFNLNGAFRSFTIKSEEPFVIVGGIDNSTAAVVPVVTFPEVFSAPGPASIPYLPALPRPVDLIYGGSSGGHDLTVIYIACYSDVRPNVHITPIPNGSGGAL